MIRLDSPRPSLKPRWPFGINWTHPLSDGLTRVYWAPLVDGASREDLSLDSPTMAASGVDRVGGVIGGLVGRYDGSAGIEYWSHNPFGQSSDGECSVAVLVRTTLSATSTFMFAAGSSTSNTPLIGLGTGTSNGALPRLFARNSSNTVIADLTGSGAFNDGHWHWLLGTVPSTGGFALTKLFLDGAEVAGDNVTGTGAYALNRVALGGVRRAATSLLFGGDIAVAMFWNRRIVKTADEGQQLLQYFNPSTGAMWSLYDVPTRRLYVDRVEAAVGGLVPFPRSFMDGGLRSMTGGMQ